MSFIQKIQAPIAKIPSFQSFTVLGDPGCDGLGAEVLSLYAQALTDAAGQFVLVAGDLVPEGWEDLYRQTDTLIARTAKVPVYMLRGNHDTGAYNDHYGLSAYAVYDEETLLVILDNALDAFTAESVALLEKAVREVSFRSLILSMHVPPPNSITKKAVKMGEWEKIRRVLRENNCAEKLSYVIAGHVHSYFEDGIDGAVTIVTGGAGARIAEMDKVETPYNHYVEFTQKDGKWQHERVNLSFANSPKRDDEKLAGLVEQAFAEECKAFVRYLLLAEDARERGLLNLGRLYSAIAHAEYYHARNFFYTNGNMQEPLDAVRTSITTEAAEATVSYPEAKAHAETVKDGLAAAAFKDTMQVEKAHMELLKQAQKHLEAGTDIDKTAYFTCTSCGATFTGERPMRCPICGAPFDKIEQEA